MSCHGCAAKFGVFTKERGCPGCGFAFCKKCLRFKTTVPKLGMTEQDVCRSCFEKYSSEKKDAEKESITPPDVFLRQLESLENPARPPITVYHHDARMEELKTGLTAEDREIAERLEKLKEERKRQREVPTEEDIVRRLAALKGQNPERAVEVTLRKKEVFNFPDTRTDEQKTNDLIKQLIEEQILAVKHISPEDLIAKRLARLRSDEGSPSNENEDVNLENLAGGSSKIPEVGNNEDLVKLMKEAKAELDAVQREFKPGDSKGKRSVGFENEFEESDDNHAVDDVVKKVMEEAALDDDEDDDDDDNDDDDDLDLESRECSDTQELPTCTICYEDPVISCLSCEDLFCDRCFTDYHEDINLQHHRKIPFSSKKKK